MSGLPAYGLYRIAPKKPSAPADLRARLGDSSCAPADLPSAGPDLAAESPAAETAGEVDLPLSLPGHPTIRIVDAHTGELAKTTGFFRALAQIDAELERHAELAIRVDELTVENAALRELYDRAVYEARDAHAKLRAQAIQLQDQENAISWLTAENAELRRDRGWERDQ